MNRFGRVRALMLVASGLALAGCGGLPSAPANRVELSDTDVVTAAVLAVPAYTSDSLLDRSGAAVPQAARAGRTAGRASEVMPDDHWRTVTSADRTLGFLYGDADSTGRPRQVEVTVTRRLRGTLQVIAHVAADSAPGASPTAERIVSKPLDETWTRRIRLRRLPDLARSAPRWVVTGLSAVASVSRPAGTGIVNVRVQATGVDTLVSDAQAFWRLSQTLAVAPGDSIRLTVMPTGPDALVSRYEPRSRESFRNLGNGTFSLVVGLAPNEFGARAVAIEALAPATLYDDEAPCDGTTWVLGYWAGPRPAGEQY